MSLQIIDREGQFNENLREYMLSNGLVKSGLKYSVVSIIGGQSSGKSTLLNNLFGTEFNTMNSEHGRTQTTEGIWCAKSRDMNTLILDVEGTDGREKWEDKKAFENKSALLSLALTDVMMVNLWEKEVGRFTAANLPLLKTVFEVHLRLFAHHGSSQKPLLLFIIRDCDGRTPPEKLHGTIASDVDRIWSEMIKPDAAKESSVSDFFDLQSVAFPHFVYQSESWFEKVQELKSRFADPQSDGYVFGNRDEKSVPADGFADFAAQLWRTIESEGDLDLPSQRKMLSQFKCRAKAAALLKVLEESLSEVTTQALRCDPSSLDTRGTSSLAKDFGTTLSSVTSSTFASYIGETSGYDSEIREEEEVSLASQIWTHLKPAFDSLSSAIFETHRNQFAASLAEFVKKFSVDEAQADWQRFFPTIQKQTTESFSSQVESLLPQVDNEKLRPSWPVSHSIRQMSEEIQREMAGAKQKLVANIVSSTQQTLRRRLNSKLVPILDAATPDMWHDILALRLATLTDEITHISPILTALDASGEVDKLPGMLSDTIHERVSERAKERSLEDSMFRKFDSLFNKNRSRNWSTWDDLDAAYTSSRDEALRVMELFRISGLGEVLNYDPPQFLSEREVGELRIAFEARCVSELEWARVRSAEAAKMQLWKNAPWGVALCLGLNEIMWLLSNPLYLFLIIIVAALAAGFYLQKKLGNYGAVGGFVQMEALKLFANFLPAPPAEDAPTREARNLKKTE